MLQFVVLLHARLLISGAPAPDYRVNACRRPNELKRIPATVPPIVSAGSGDYVCGITARQFHTRFPFATLGADQILVLLHGPLTDPNHRPERPAELISPNRLVALGF
ncbi:hypothetical protein [Oceanibacterium hippocampi]|uniref:hypothetical protein n=1 Tax=Oceanibacterium hippocampi TaxID=745714 RepID=UPI00111C80C9|nr:hypothetical protein [Oceanibacterium hippocampi]